MGPSKTRIESVVEMATSSRLSVLSILPIDIARGRPVKYVGAEAMIVPVIDAGILLTTP